MKSLPLLLSAFLAVAKTEAGPKLSFENVPREDVMSVQGFLEPEVFFENHVAKDVPVVMRNAASEFASDLDISRLEDIPESYTTYMEMMQRGDDTSTNYQFLKIYGEENLYVNTPIPTVIK